MHTDEGRLIFGENDFRCFASVFKVSGDGDDDPRRRAFATVNPTPFGVRSTPALPWHPPLKMAAYFFVLSSPPTNTHSCALAAGDWVPDSNLPTDGRLFVYPGTVTIVYYRHTLRCVMDVVFALSDPTPKSFLAFRRQIKTDGWNHGTG